jgi:hypothetical protein
MTKVPTKKTTSRSNSPSSDRKRFPAAYVTRHDIHTLGILPAAKVDKLTDRQMTLIGQHMSHLVRHGANDYFSLVLEAVALLLKVDSDDLRDKCPRCGHRGRWQPNFDVDPRGTCTYCRLGGEPPRKWSEQAMKIRPWLRAETEAWRQMQDRKPKPRK